MLFVRLFVSLPHKVNTKAKRYIQFFLCVVATLVIGITALLNSPRVQQWVSVVIASELENHIGTRVELGSVHWLFPNDIVINSLSIDDQEGEELLSVKKIAAKVEWKPLLKHQLSIRNVRIFYPNINIYKEDSAAVANYQFLINAFATKKQKKETKLNLRINSLLVRHADFNYNLLSEEQPADRFSPQHIDIDNLSTHISLKTITNDTISLMVRSLNFREKSGMQVDDLYFRLVGNHHGATLANFHLELPHTSLMLDTLWASYSPENFTESLVLKGAILPSYMAPKDFSFMLPEMESFRERIYLSAQFRGSLQKFDIKDVVVNSDNRAVRLKANTTTNLTPMAEDIIDLDLQEFAWDSESWSTLKEQLPTVYERIPQEIVRLGKVEAHGKARLSNKKSEVRLFANTDAGKVNAVASIDSKGAYYADVEGTRINVAQIVPQSPLAQTNINLKANGKYIPNAAGEGLPIQSTLKLEGEATNTVLLGYKYETISLKGEYSPSKIEGDVTVKDPNANLTLLANYKNTETIPNYHVVLKADSLDLYAMNLIKIHNGKSFSVDIKGEARGEDLDHLAGDIEINNLTMHRGTDDFKLGNIKLVSIDSLKKDFSIQSTFINGTVCGDFLYHDLIERLSAQLYHYLPSLNNEPHHCPDADFLNCSVVLALSDAQPLQELLLLPISFNGNKEVNIKASINQQNSCEINVTFPELNYNGQIFHDGELVCETSDSCLYVNVNATKVGEKNIGVDANITAANDCIKLETKWDSSPSDFFEGKFNATANLWNTADDELAIHVKTDTSSSTLHYSQWELYPFEVYVTPQYTSIHDFHLAQDTIQYIDIEGSISQSSSDTLSIKLGNMDLSYLLSFVKLKGLSFGANMSGHINASALYSPKPYIDADIDAKNFKFCKGNLGDAKIHAFWNQDSTRLEFNADINETPLHTTNIDGLVDIAKNELWLDIDADSTNLSFLNELLGSFMSEVRGNASGHLLLGGKLDSLDLKDGALLADADFRLIPTNTYYGFSDSLYFEPGKILFKEIELKDLRGNDATLNGIVTHKRINEFAYNLDISARNILGIDIPDTGNESFYTTIYGSGNINVNGGPRQPLKIDINAYPEAESVFALNLAGQDVTSSEAFLTYRDRYSQRNQLSYRDRTTRMRRNGTEVSPLQLKIITNVTPNAKLKLVMDQTTDDHISVTGNGTLDININDDDIQLFGRYTINRGSYNFSLQDLINKKFDVQQGSYVDFEGDPTAAQLNITARHIVAQAPMRDLSPELTSNVQVNCLLHIKGTLNNPTISFDLELPKGTEEEKSILRSYTSTEEQRNLQFIYLLGLGKFYTQDVTQTGQSVGMETLVSNTISGQFNNLISSIIDNDKWNFSSAIRRDNLLGANTTDNTWDNMEIEGILEGSLLNNRLLINGNFGYRDNPIYASNFIGDFDLRYLLNNGVSVKGYSKTNDRYFTKTSLYTQGVGLLFQRDFNYLFKRKKKNTETKEKK